LDAPVRALLADGERLFVATDSGVRIVLQGESPTSLAPTPVEPDDPSVTGQVRSLAMRRDGTLLAAAEKGLFLWDGKQLTRSPVSTLVGSPERVALAVHGVERWAVSQGTRVLH
jgi:hypothetical protein